MLFGLLTLLIAEHRPQVYIIFQAVADPQPFSLMDQSIGELLCHLICHIDPVDADTDLSHIGEGPLGAGGSSFFEIGIGTDDEGRVPSQLQ
jgi:hypothetical protein